MNKKKEKKENKQLNSLEKKYNKKFIERVGDWYCNYCNNLNFSFRKACNRCRLPKYYWK